MKLYEVLRDLQDIDDVTICDELDHEIVKNGELGAKNVISIEPFLDFDVSDFVFEDKTKRVQITLFGEVKYGQKSVF